MDEYKVLKVKLNKDVKSHHCLYYKPHKLNSQKTEDESSNDLSSRTLFVYNVPPYAANETALKTVFSCFGRVENVLLYAKPKRNPFADLISSQSAQESSYFKNVSFDEDENEFSMVETETNADDAKFCFKVAYLVFAESEAVDRAQNKPFGDKPRFLQDSSSSYIKVGLKKWISDYEKEFVNEAKLSKEIDEFMKNYDEKKEQEDKEQDDLNQPDEDGWVTVTAKSRKSNRPFTEKNIEKIQKKQKKRKQQMQLVNFYSFQMKESKKEYIAQLRKKFEEDKKKIEAMKTSRKFKPF